MGAVIGVAVLIAQTVMVAVSGFFWFAVKNEPGAISAGTDLLLLVAGGAGVLGALAGWVTGYFEGRREWVLYVTPAVFALVAAAAAWIALYVVASFDCMLAAETFNCAPPSSDKAAVVFGLEIGIVVYATTAAVVQLRNSSVPGVRR